MRRLDKHPKKLVESDRFLQIYLSWLAQAIHYSDTDLILHTCLHESMGLLKDWSWFFSSNGSLDCGILDGWGSFASLDSRSGSIEAWGANFDGNALLISTEATVLIVGNTDSLLLWDALGVLSGSLSLSEVNSFKDRDGTLDGKGSVLCLNGEGGMGSLSAFAAVGLADLIVLSVRGSSQLLDLSGFNVLLVALAETGTEAWELFEVAWAWDLGIGEIEALVTDVTTAVSGSGVSMEVVNLGLSKVLGSLLTEAGLEGVLGCSSDDTSEESKEDDLH